MSEACQNTQLSERSVKVTTDGIPGPCLREIMLWV